MTLHKANYVSSGDFIKMFFANSQEQKKLIENLKLSFKIVPEIWEMSNSFCIINRAHFFSISSNKILEWTVRRFGSNRLILILKNLKKLKKNILILQIAGFIVKHFLYQMALSKNHTVIFGKLHLASFTPAEIHIADTGHLNDAIANIP